MKLAKKDITLLHALAQNSRATTKELSMISNYSQETVQKRIQEFKDFNIITSYSTQIPITQLFNLQEYIGFITLNSSTTSQIHELISYLISSKFTSWIGRGIGAFDIKISIYIQHLKEINEFEQSLHLKFPTIISSIQWNQIISKYKNSSNSIISNCLQESKINITTNNTSFSTSKKIPKTLHPLQIQLLYELSDNSRLTLQELSQKLNTTLENTHYHFKKLQQNKLLNQFSIILNISYFNKHATILFLKIQSSQIQDIITKLLKRTNVTSILEVVGVYNLQITILNESMNSTFEEIESIKSEFSQEILQSQYFFTHSFYKYPKLPKIIFETN